MRRNEKITRALLTWQVLILLLSGSSLPAEEPRPPATSLSMPDERLLLTPDNAKEQGYWIRAAVSDSRRDDGASSPELRRVRLRLGIVHGGRLHPGQWTVGVKDLQIIKATTLVIQKGDEIVLRAPLRMVVDPGNEVHWYVEIDAHPEWTSNLAIEFEEHLESEVRRYAVPINAFVDQR
jgi:hypothetical protein